jgi:hypothetical protein
VPQFAPALTAIGSFLASTGAVAVLVKTILINVALGAIAKALTKKPRQDNSVPPVNITVRGTIENRRLVFGTRRVGGVMAFYGAAQETNNVLYYVVVLAGHQVNDIKDVWLDTVKIEDANIDPSTGAVTQGDYTGNLSIYRYNGTAGQAVNASLDADYALWTSDHRLRGCAYMVIRMTRNETAFPTGAPQSASALVEGALIYDPRLDSTNGGSGSHRQTDATTWAYSANPALIARWYLSGGSVTNDVATPLVRYGLKEPAARIDDAYFIAAANVCDETVSGANAPPSGSQARYQCHLEATTGQTRRTILEDILASMAGRLVMNKGRWRVYAGDYETPLHALTQDDLQGEMEVQDTTPHTERYNAVAAVFPDAGNGYLDRTTLFRTDSAYETQDGSERLPVEVDLRGVTNEYQAQRLAEIMLRRSRMMRTVKIVGGRSLLKVALQENVTLSHSRYGWSNRVFRCVERQFEYAEESGKVTLTLQQEASSVYTDMVTADYTTGTSDTDEFQAEIPEAPTGLTVTGVRDGMQISWTLGTFWQLHGIVELWRHTAATPFSSATKIWEGRGNSAFIAQNSLTQGYYWVTVRTINGQRGAAYPATTSSPIASGVAGRPLSLTQWVARGNCIAGGTSARKIGGSTAYDSDVYSIDSYQNCHLQWKAGQTNARIVVGLTTNPTAGLDFDDIEYGMYTDDSGSLYIIRSGSTTSVGTYTIESLLAITYDGSTVRYLVDAVEVGTDSASSLTLFADSSFYTPNSSINSFSFGPGTALDRIGTAQIDTDAIGEQYYDYQAGPVTGGLSGVPAAYGPNPLHDLTFTVSSDGLVWATFDFTASRNNGALLFIAIDGTSTGVSADVLLPVANTDYVISRTIAFEVLSGDTVTARLSGKYSPSQSLTISESEINVRFFKR